MRLTEIFEDNNPRKEVGFDMAWQNKKDGIPQEYHSKVRTTAQNQLSKGHTPTAAIDNAWDIIKLEIQKQNLAKNAAISRPQPVKTTEPNPGTDRVRRSITKGDLDGAGKSGRRWGNQYYSNPANSDGVKGVLAKNRPVAVAKRAADKFKQVASNATDIENLPNYFKQLNPKNRRK